MARKKTPEIHKRVIGKMEECLSERIDFTGVFYKYANDEFIY